MNRPLGAQISYMLKDRGVDVIFGIPGVHNQEMYRGIEEAGITHVLARHEQGAGFMADGYARATGRYGVCYIITGPGLCNTMTPLGQAYSDNVSVLAISSCLDDVTGRKGQLHQMKDQRAAGATVCDWSEQASDATTAYRLIDKALRQFFCGDPRPKHIQVPISALQGQAAPHGDFARGEGRMMPEPVNVAYAASQLKAAKRPLLIVGGGAVDLARDGGEIAALMDATGCASFSTYAGRGILPMDHPLHFGPNLGRPDSARVIAEADLVLVIGSQLAEVDTWRDALGHTANMIRVDMSDDRLNTDVGAFFNVRADAQSFAQALLAALGDHRPQTEWTAQGISRARARWRAEVDAEFPGILPVTEALKAVLPDDTMIYSDMTQFAYAANETWDMRHPGHWHHPSGFGTLGYALPAAIGGAVARPGLPTIAIAGDYGFQYTVQEMGVAAELGLPLPILLWDNGKLGAIEASMIHAQIAPNAVIQQNPDFSMLAQAYGVRAERPASLDALQAAVTEALCADGPTLIHMTPALVG